MGYPAKPIAIIRPCRFIRLQIMPGKTKWSRHTEPMKRTTTIFENKKRKKRFMMAWAF
jgi:hypothetical protein